jgi:hypothetical protein
MENEIENDNSNNVEEAETTDSTNGTEEAEETTEQYTEREKQLYARLKKAEAELKSGKTTKEPTKSNDFGYDVKAYLKSSGINANEFDFVKQEMKQAGIKDVDTLLNNKYFQSRLEEHREITKTQEATPAGKRTGGVATDSVDYWLSKPFEEVPANKRREVLNAKLAREQNRGKFYNS